MVYEYSGCVLYCTIKNICMDSTFKEFATQVISPCCVFVHQIISHTLQQMLYAVGVYVNSRLATGTLP